MLRYRRVSGQATGQIASRVAENIDAAIVANGLSTAEVARRMQTGEKAVRRWRRGDVTPNQENMQRLALMLAGGDVAWFYTQHNGRAA